MFLRITRRARLKARYREKPLAESDFGLGPVHVLGRTRTSIDNPPMGYQDRGNAQWSAVPNEDGLSSWSLRIRPKRSGVGTRRVTDSERR